MPEGIKRTLAAVMFTDMVGYTALMQVDEQLALVKRNRHREVLEETHHRFQGKIIQYFGDGTLSVFDSVVEAARCAIAIQTDLQEAPQVPLRIGLHTGDILYSETDVLGDGVNIASRLESLAVPGSILISSKVLDDIQNHVDISTQSIGIFELKNVATPMEVFAISNYGLVIPQLKDIAGKGKLQVTAKHNLPTQLTSFIGREKEVAEIKSLVLQNRLITTTGPGGTGKTRLSISVAEELLSNFSDGVYFVPLAPIREANMLASTIAKVLGVEENPTKTVLESLIDYISSKELLLVLDNFEQITDAAPDVFELLQSCSGLKILISSRIVLRIGGEQEYSVQPLLLPESNSLIDIEVLQKFPSIQLFVQRSKAVKSSFELSNQNAFEIAQICTRLDGLPLAIELAAARIRLFSPKSLLEKLSKSMDILKIKERTRPTRHQTLRQTIGWSYELLSAEEQALFQQLSVFTGFFGMEAIEEICQLSAFPEFDIYEGVEALLAQSLVRQTEDQYGDTQFILLETIKEYSWDILLKSGQANSTKRRHAQHYLEFVETAAPELIKKDQAVWLNKIADKYDNIRTGILWTLEHNEAEMGLRFGTALWRFWVVRNRVEGWQRLDSLLQLPIKEDLLLHRAKTLSAIGSTLNSIGDLDLARKKLEESISILESINDKVSLAISLNHLSCTEWATSNYQASIELAERALELGIQLDEKRTISTSYNNLGWIRNFQCRLEEAHEYYMKGAQIRKEIGDRRGYAFMLTNMSGVEIRMGDRKNINVQLAEAKQILGGQMGDKQLLAWVLAQTGEYLLTQKKWKEARINIEEAIVLWKECGNKKEELRSLIYLIDALGELHDFQLAKKYLEKVTSIFADYKNQWHERLFAAVRLRIAFKLQDFEQAITIAKTIFQHFGAIEDYYSLVHVLELFAQTKFVQGFNEESAHALTFAKIIRKEKKIAIIPRYVDQLTQLEQDLNIHLGEEYFTNLEKRPISFFEEEVKKF